eukprot:8046804-Pyramimonas_sp.AAC.1
MAEFLRAVSQTVDFIQTAAQAGSLVGDALQVRLANEKDNLINALRQAGALTLAEATQARQGRGWAAEEEEEDKEEAEEEEEEEEQGERGGGGGGEGGGEGERVMMLRRKEARGREQAINAIQQA